MYVLAAHFETSTPEATLQRVGDFFRRQPQYPAAIGIGAFGPVDLRPGSRTYGHITSTPKAGWSFTNIVGYIQKNFDVPVGFDTDGNAAALGEYTWGAGQGRANLVYLTVGTGIGGGAIVNGTPIRGLLHPEMVQLLLHAGDKADRHYLSIMPHGIWKRSIWGLPLPI